MIDPVEKKLLEDYEDFFENAPCGHLIIRPNGDILKCNQQMSQWLGHAANEIEGKRFTAFLPIGAKILYETHLAPLLRMRGAYDEMSLELVDREGARLPVLVNACERRNEAGDLLSVRLTVFKAKDRYLYERNLRTAKSVAESQLTEVKETSLLREHFIAVLGHDLRNPLGAITMGTAILEAAELQPNERKLINIMKDSTKRISDLIDDVMDFARGRLGGDMSLKVEKVQLQSVLMHVIEELRTAHPGRIIDVDDRAMGPVECDSVRISQILSNLVSNALVHGNDESPVSVCWFEDGKQFELSVANSGEPIPPNILDHIFEPFKRKDVGGGGLGLGLYITAEIAKAHQGNLSVRSTDEETRFTFEMPTSRGNTAQEPTA